MKRLKDMKVTITSVDNKGGYAGNFDPQEAIEQLIKWTLNDKPLVIRDQLRQEPFFIGINGYVFKMKYKPSIGDHCYLREGYSIGDGGPSAYTIEGNDVVVITEIQSESLIKVAYSDGRDEIEFTVVPEELIPVT